MAETSADSTRNLQVHTRLYKALMVAVLLPAVVIAVTWLTSGGSAQAGVRVQSADGLLSGGASPTTTPCALQWRAIESPNVGKLEDISAAGPNDIWAVGGYDAGGHDALLIEHWNGTSWSVVPGPSLGANPSYLYAVEAIGPNDVWAVGEYETNVLRTLVIHWNGTAWSDVPSPSPGFQSNFLHDVTAVGPNDVWAAGQFNSYCLIIHWDGISWSMVSCSDATPLDSSLEGMTAISANDIWAVGFSTESTTYWRDAFIEHWNGTEWALVPSPSLTNYDYLNDVEAVTANDIWAVGGTSVNSLVEHWDGSTWSVVPSPNVENEETRFTSIATISTNDVWAVVNYGLAPTQGSMAAHWDGVSWSLMPVEILSPYRNALSGITAIGPMDVWATGGLDTSFSENHTLIEHYSSQCTTPVPTIPPPMSMTVTPPTETPTSTPTGTSTATETPVCLYSWHEVLSANLPSSDRSFLNGVVAISANDAWAVGQSWDSGVGGTPLIEHWDGETWSISAAPVITSENVNLYGVWATATDDVWAVGSYEAAGLLQSLTIHWDGSEWMVVPSPNPGGEAFLRDVTGVSVDDVWAVGSTVLHWNGIEWSVVASPSEVELKAISALSANDIWAVGNTAGETQPVTLTMHWDGSEWTTVPSPNGGADGNLLNDVVAISTNDVWAVGTRGETIPTLGTRNLALHWDGTQWALVEPPSFADYNTLNGVTAFSSEDVWAVGNSGSDTVTLHWDGTSWTRSISPDPANVNNLNGVIAMPNGEMWAVGHTATGPIGYTLIERYSSTTFSDIPPGHTFYPYINCIACRGIALGYPDGTFRSNNPITRGQIAKLLVIASRPIGSVSPISPIGSSQYFEDVPPGSTFYDYVQAIGLVVEGYPCGGPGEPCVPPGNLPYYRPSGTASRGQLSKIVSEVAGFNDTIPAGTQTFTDVQPGSTFYVFIERLILNRPGVMHGYPCGGFGEPCDLQNRPYFRPSNTVTRGQAAKIVANTFFPNCQPPAP